MIPGQNSISCICKKKHPRTKDTKIVICNLCHQSQHKDCFKDLIKMKPFYICPMCYFDINDIFLNKIDNILKPVDIIPHTLKHRSTFRFRKDFNKEIKNNFIVVRCLKIGKKGYKLGWPDAFTVLINNKLVVKFDKYTEDVESNYTGPIVFRFVIDNSLNHYFDPYRQRIFNVMEFFNLKKENTFDLLIDYDGRKKPRDKEQFHYIITIDLVDVLTSEGIIQTKIKEKNQIPVIKDLFKGDTFIKEQITFEDIYTNVDIIDLPGRGWKCLHMRCFDIKHFLDIEKIAKKYRCPFCNKRIGLLYFDNKMNEIKHIWLKDRDKDKFNLLIDGDYNMFKEQKIGHKKKRDKSIVIEIENEKNSEILEQYQQIHIQQEKESDIDNSECQNNSQSNIPISATEITHNHSEPVIDKKTQIILDSSDIIDINAMECLPETQPSSSTSQINNEKINLFSKPSKEKKYQIEFKKESPPKNAKKSQIIMNNSFSRIINEIAPSLKFYTEIQSLLVAKKEINI